MSKICATCKREHVKGVWWPRHPFKAIEVSPQYPGKRPDCPFPGCSGGCVQCSNARLAVEAKKVYAARLREFQEGVHKECFPDGEPKHGDLKVDHLMKMMFVNTITKKAFDAGWVAAGREVPS